MRVDTKARYGEWAVVAGASEGLGAAFAEALAMRVGTTSSCWRGRAEVLEALGQELKAKHKVQVRSIACDLADARFGEVLQQATGDLSVGVAVYNAAYSYMGRFLERPIEDALRVVDVNVRGPLRFVHTLASGMVTRQRGAIVLMSSQAGFQGVATIATYAASKAFNIVLGEGLWKELKPRGVDVVVSCAGAISTPNYLRTMTKRAPGTLPPIEVANQSLDALGKGPLISPGLVNKLALFLLGRLLPRTSAIRDYQQLDRESASSDA